MKDRTCILGRWGDQQNSYHWQFTVLFQTRHNQYQRWNPNSKTRVIQHNRRLWQTRGLLWKTEQEFV